MKREARPKVTAPHPQRSTTESSSRSIAALPAPRYALGWAALVYAASTLCLGYPALLGKFLVNPASDQYIAGYAFREFAASTIRQTGGFPLWNPYLFGGMPYVAAMHGDIFYPTFLLRMVLPTDIAMTWGFIIHLFLAGLFTYLFLRAWGFGFFPALVAGVAYMLSGQIASYASPGHDGKLFVSALFPLVLLLVLRGIRDGRLWAWGSLALTIGLAVLSPHPQLLQYLLLSSGAFALFCAFGRAGEGSSGLDRKVAVRRLACAAGAVILGLAIGAIQYLPVREYVDWSPRAGGVGYDRATSYSMPIEELINVYLPQFSGAIDAYWGRNPIKLHSEYLGVVVLVLAFSAFGAGAVRQARKRFLWFWIATTTVALFWALGGNTPFYHLVYALVPGTKFFRAPSTIFFIVCFGIAVLSAIGLERILTREVGQRYAFGWLIGASAVALLATAGGFTGLATSIATPQQFDAAQANSSAVIFGAWRSFLFVAIACGVLLALLRQKLTAKAAAWALVAAVGLDLWSVERRYWMFSRPAHQLYASDPIIEYIKKQNQPGRVLQLPLAPTEAPRDPFFQGDALMAHDIRIVLGYHGNHLGRYDLVQANLGNPNVWKLENVRYLLTNVPESPIPGAEKLVGPVKNAAGSTSYLFSVPGDNPAAWVTPVIVKAPDDAVQATVFNPAFDLRRAALFDTSAKVRGQQITALPDTLPIHASVMTYRPGRIAVQLDAPAPAGSALIVSENYYPGWQATADGKPANTGRADLVLVGVELPAGARKVELTFRSTAYEKGKTVTLVAFAACLALALGGFLVGRRRRQAQLDKGHAAGA